MIGHHLGCQPTAQKACENDVFLVVFGLPSCNSASVLIRDTIAHYLEVTCFPVAKRPPLRILYNPFFIS